MDLVIAHRVAKNILNPRYPKSPGYTMYSGTDVMHSSRLDSDVRHQTCRKDIMASNGQDFGDLSFNRSSPDHSERSFEMYTEKEAGQKLEGSNIPEYETLGNTASDIHLLSEKDSLRESERSFTSPSIQPKVEYYGTKEKAFSSRLHGDEQLYEQETVLIRPDLIDTASRFETEKRNNDISSEWEQYLQQQKTMNVGGDYDLHEDIMINRKENLLETTMSTDNNLHEDIMGQDRKEDFVEPLVLSDSSSDPSEYFSCHSDWSSSISIRSKFLKIYLAHHILEGVELFYGCIHLQHVFYVLTPTNVSNRI